MLASEMFVLAERAIESAVERIEWEHIMEYASMSEDDADQILGLVRQADVKVTF